MGATAEAIADAEQELGTTLPLSYKRFLQDFGWASLGANQIFGLGSDVPPFLDLVRITLSERTECVPHLPVHLIPLLNNGGGDLECLDTSRFMAGECPIVFRSHETGRVTNQVAAEFADWMLHYIELAEEDAG